MATSEGGSSKNCQFKMGVTGAEGWGGLGRDLPHSRKGAPILSGVTSGVFRQKSHW